MKKKILCILLAVCMAAALMPEALFAAGSAPADYSRYFFNQLTDTAKIFYDGMVKMYEDDMFIQGDAALDLAQGNPQMQILAQQQMSGTADLLSEFGAARDAFYADYPDIFYVDFSALTLRITRDATNFYHVYIGPGRYKTYYTAGIDNVGQALSLLNSYREALDAAVQIVSLEPTAADKIKAAHDYLTKSVTYRDETLVSPSNIGFIRTAYGALVCHEGVCEAYTRAFKAIMDSLGIPNVVTYGMYRHSEELAEFHIWNEVFVDGKWYAVDVTMDDPINVKKAKSGDPSDGVDGYENRQHLLVGSSVMDQRHVVSNVVSESGFYFEYPEISEDSFGIEQISSAESPLKVRYGISEFEGIEESGTYYVSYMGMNLTEMIQNGYYLIMRNKVYDVEKGWDNTDWYYVIPEIYDRSAFPDIGSETMFNMGHVEYVEFGVTDIPYPKPTPDVLIDQFFYGDPTLLLADSGMIKNEHGGYRAAPMVMKAQPALTGGITIGETHHVKAYYNDILVTPDVYENYCKNENINDPNYKAMLMSAKMSDATVKLTVRDRMTGRVQPADEYYNSLIKNFKLSFEGQQTVLEFDFTPSELWNDDSVFYDFELLGLVGAYSGKPPAEFSYHAVHPCAICTYKRYGFDYNTFAKPVLVADDDLSMNGWKDSDGNVWEDTPWDDQLKQRLMLVATDASVRDSHSMDDLIEKNGNDLLSSKSYNISLTLCKKQFADLKDGMGVRVMLGFPDGYGPNDAGVTFKAYHFNKDEKGAIVGIEEIPCTITPYGLLIECRSFSPFTVAAVADDGSASKEKSVVIMSDGCGKVTATGSQNGIVTLKEGQSVTVTVTPEAGYDIDTVEASGTSKSVYSHETSAYSFTLSYSDITDRSAIVSAKFISAEVAEKEVGEKAIPSAVSPAGFSIAGSQTVIAYAGQDVTLEISAPIKAYTYNWYKAGPNGSDKFVGSGEKIVISGKDLDGNSLNNTGNYYCVAVATAGASTAQTKSSNMISVISGTVNPDETPQGGLVPQEVLPHGGFGANPNIGAFPSGGAGTFAQTHQHRYAKWGVSPTMHWLTCADCGTTTDFSEHTFVGGVCIFCGYSEADEFFAGDEVTVETPTEGKRCEEDR